MPTPPSDPASPFGDAGSDGADAPDSAPISSRSAVAVVPIRPEDTEPDPDSGPRARTVREALRRFVGSSKEKHGQRFVRSVVITKLYGPNPKEEGIDEDLVGEIASRSVQRVLEAKTPPWTVRGIRGWVVRLTGCTVADYFEATKSDRKYLDRSADPVSWADRHQPATDWGAREHLIVKWLEGQIGDDPAKEGDLPAHDGAQRRGQVARGDRERERHDRAGARQPVPQAAKRARADGVHHGREKPRRGILALLVLGGLAIVVASLVALWRATPPVVPTLPLPKPVPSMSTEPVPTFDQAPPRREPAPPPEDKGTRETKP